jgi:hypothetical protein
VYQPCEPPVAPIKLGDDESPAITVRMRELFATDQAARLSAPIDWPRLAQEDAQRRQETMTYLLAGQICTAESLYYAAFIFQHGNCPEHYDLAHQLAEYARQRGYDAARWLCAATLDRALMSRNLPQKYGTQYVAYGDGPLELYSYDPDTTDEERREYDVPPLHELLGRSRPEVQH